MATSNGPLLNAKVWSGAPPIETLTLSVGGGEPTVAVEMAICTAPAEPALTVDGTETEIAEPSLAVVRVESMDFDR